MNVNQESGYQNVESDGKGGDPGEKTNLAT
jgi:hypothetical protein